MTRRDVATAQLIAPVGDATRLAHLLRSYGWRGPISLAAHNPQPTDDLEDVAS